MSCLRSLVEGQLAGLHWDFRAGTVAPWQGEGDFLRAGELHIDPPDRAVGRTHAEERAMLGRVDECGEADVLVLVGIQRQLMHAYSEGLRVDAPKHRHDVARNDCFALGSERKVWWAAVGRRRPLPALQADELGARGEIEHEDTVAAKSPDALARRVDLLANVRRSPLRHGGVLAACERDEHCGG